MLNEIEQNADDRILFYFTLSVCFFLSIVFSINLNYHLLLIYRLF